MHYYVEQDDERESFAFMVVSFLAVKRDWDSRLLRLRTTLTKTNVLGFGKYGIESHIGRIGIKSSVVANFNLLLLKRMRLRQPSPSS
jgi:hypothetical protein